MSGRKLIIFVLAAIFTIYIVQTMVQVSQTVATYEKAMELMAEENYEEAVKQLRSIYEDGHKDTRVLIDYCDANIAYSKGDISKAYDELKYVTCYYQTEEQQNKIDRFKESVEQDYNEYLEKKREEEAAAYERKIRYGVPFVGMPESRIDDTSLGFHSRVRHNWESMEGGQYVTNIYDFHVGTKLIFSARCCKGKVINVWDYREEDDSNSKTTNRITNKTYQDEDPYNASDYSDPEDFYEDNYDDFWDYEDAEDYWNEYS